MIFLNLCELICASFENFSCVWSDISNRAQKFAQTRTDYPSYQLSYYLESFKKIVQ